MRTFIRPEDETARGILVKYMDQILFGLHDFLRQHVGITKEISLKALADRFTDYQIRRDPEKRLVEVIADLVEDIGPHAVNVASPYFVGHMTSAIPFFMIHLKTITAALNQNVVKLETSKVVSIIEKQVQAKVHRQIFKRSDSFYRRHVQNPYTALGAFTEDGTLANVTALWVARSALFSPRGDFQGVETDGLVKAYQEYGVDRTVVLVSRLGHYSLKKAGGLLGIGYQNVIPIDTDSRGRVQISELRKTIAALQKPETRTRVLAVIGIAGTTETGTVDPLPTLGEICWEHRIHFHVDAAWGGPVLFSERYAELLDGIEMADSVTVDGHKQFYMPMTCGMVFFRNPKSMDGVAYHANYVNRLGSADLGIKTLSGSREATSLILDSALKIMGTGGYSLLIDHGIDTAKEFAREIGRRSIFELTSAPELNILTYRICPAEMRRRLKSAEGSEREALQEKLNTINRRVQRLQREAGKSFVSRTTLKSGLDAMVVLRVVIMNPFTTQQILSEILDEQEAIYHENFSDPDRVS